MKKQIVAINLPNKEIELFRPYFLLDQLELFSCRSLADAITLLAHDTFCQIILDATTLSSDDAQEAVRKLRNITYREEHHGRKPSRRIPRRSQG